MDVTEKNICMAEICFKSGQISQSLKYAHRALKTCDDINKRVALRLFIAKILGKQGKIHESNAEYRRLINDQVFLPPIMLGLLYNSVQLDSIDKMATNLNLVKVFTGLGLPWGEH